jgi:hypothetical protein
MLDVIEDLKTIWDAALGGDPLAILLVLLGFGALVGSIWAVAHYQNKVRAARAEHERQVAEWEEWKRQWGSTDEY